MRKFKLIQTYPESPPLGTVIIKTIITGSENTIETYCIWGKDKNCDGGKFRIPNPWLYKYNWKEIIEKDYEILSFRGRRFKEDIWKLLPNGDYNYGIINIDGNYKNWSKDMCLKALDIHSIKRLSDSEVFTIGDFVKETVTGQCKGWEIKEFSLKDTRCFSCGVNINNIIKHAKTALFKTFDGVDIFKGDEFYIITTSFNDKNKQNSCKQIATDYYKGYNEPPSFSTKEKAEKHILMNKPCLSINDVMNAGYGICSPNPLINIVKSKE